jgi:hypothetical protein
MVDMVYNSTVAKSIELLLEVGEWNEKTDDWTIDTSRGQFAIEFSALYLEAVRSECIGKVEPILAAIATLLEDRYGEIMKNEIVVKALTEAITN